MPEFITPQLMTSVLVLVVVLHLALGLAAYFILLERKVCAWIQDRIGPNRVGTMGLLQPIADGLKPVRAGELTFEIISGLIDNIVLVDDEAILEAARHLVWKEKLVVEPSGAATFAAIRSGKITLPEGPAVLVVSGGNVDLGRMLGISAV